MPTFTQGETRHLAQQIYFTAHVAEFTSLNKESCHAIFVRFICLDLSASAAGRRQVLSSRYPSMRNGFISYQSNDDLHCHYEFKLPAPIAVNITFSKGRYIRVNSEGKYEESTFEVHMKEFYSMWTVADEVWLRGLVEQHKRASQVSA
ncbi:MAG: hypothetical protein ACP5EP_09690 [Acidobacteriaceae bacterium]